MIYGGTNHNHLHEKYSRWVSVRRIKSCLYAEVILIGWRTGDCSCIKYVGVQELLLPKAKVRLQKEIERESENGLRPDFCV